MSLSLRYFEDMYAASTDPWGFTDRWYEQRKYALTIASLPRARYTTGFEPGCSIGVLTAMLASRCDHLLSIDPVPAAVSAARERLADQPHVRVRQGQLTDPWPGAPFGLIVLSEVGYYLDDDELAPTLRRAADALEPEGDLVAVHWRDQVPEYPQPGDTVHKVLATTAGIERLGRHEERDFLLEIYTKTPPPPRSVAQREGLC